MQTKILKSTVFFLNIALALTLISNCFIIEIPSKISDSFSKSSDSASKSSDSIASLSNSIKSISGSLSGFISSFSTSSSKDDKKAEAIYKMDVRDITAIYATSDFAANALGNDLELLAKRNGITNWKSYQVTYIAIGEGLKKANISEKSFQVIKTNIAKTNMEVANLVQTGFNSVR